MAVKLNDYVDDDMIITGLLFSGMAQNDIDGLIRRHGGNVRKAFEAVKDDPTYKRNNRFDNVKSWLDHVGTGNLEKLLTETAGIKGDVAKTAIYKAQREVGGVATPTLDRVLFFLGSEPDGRAQSFAATIRPQLQGLGRSDSALMTTRTQYKTGQKPVSSPAPPPPPAAAPPPGGPPAAGFPGTTAPKAATDRPAQPLQQPKKTPPGGTLAAATGADTRTAAPSAGIRNLPLLSPTAGEEEVVKYIRKYYGHSAWILDIPELRGRMIEVAKDFAGVPVDEATIQGRFTDLEWWQTHSGAQRLAIEEKATDPATYNAKVEAKYREMAVLAGQVGFTVSEPRLREMARQAYDLGMTTAEMRSALAAEFDYNPETGQEDQTRIVSDLRSLASDYLVPLGEQTIDQWGRQIIAGTSTSEDFTAYAKSVAKGMFGHYASDIDAGRTVKQIADPFIQTAMKDLELTQDQIDLMDPKWRKALEMDPETGAPMQLSKWQRMIRTDSSYGWDYTQNARAEAAEFGKKIAESFGRA